MIKQEYFSSDYYLVFTSLMPIHLHWKLQTECSQHPEKVYLFGGEWGPSSCPYALDCHSYESCIHSPVPESQTQVSWIESHKFCLNLIIMIAES